MNIPNGLPLLATGSHVRGSGYACIMNAISYMKGDHDITDFPDCVYAPLAAAAQHVNDFLCTHKPGQDLLCSECSHQVWMIGARLMGTAEPVKKLSLAKKRQLRIALATRFLRIAKAGLGLPAEYHKVVDDVLRQAEATARRNTNANQKRLRDARDSYRMQYTFPATAYKHEMSRVAPILHGIVNDLLNSMGLVVFAAAAISPLRYVAVMHELIDLFEELTKVKVKVEWTEADYRLVATGMGTRVA
jgi:hypothetical protein